MGEVYKDKLNIDAEKIKAALFQQVMKKLSDNNEDEDADNDRITNELMSDIDIESP